jgi:bifunctional non-homologous end joining protein LigD
MPLDEYRRKRNFAATPEPRGGGPLRRDRLFVVQKHAASRLHYDFRLEVDGVLVSWAVPRGPSMNPADKRLAVRTEDHPLEYADFEGVIPAGQYGAGRVEIWDRGTYEPAEDVPMAQQVERGKVVVVLKGKKLRGRFALVRAKLGGASKRENWLLIKQR